MKKTNLNRWLLSVLAAMAVFSAPAAKKTFTAVAANVDGLPPVVHINALGIVKRDITMNEDGSTEKGATRMGQLFQNRMWDLIGLSEDFNYHSYITQECNTYYNSTTYRGKIDQENLDGAITGYLSQSVHMNTDGLNLLYRNKYRVLSETIVKWNDHHGYDDHEADGLINKGFRKYEISFGDKLNVDVYITHMDAGSCDAIGDCEEKEEVDKCKAGGDIGARTKQMQQLVAYIIANTTTNPVIILGDTNCRYTRDTVKRDLIDAINADPRLTISDPWLEQDYWKERGGFDAPELQIGQGSVMVSNPAYGEQLGEVVDKVFYINNTDSDCKLTCTGYLHDDTFTYADGSQIADHYPVVATMTIENSYTPAENPFVIPPAPEKTAVANGGKYYIRNVGTGQFIRAGKNWGTKSILDTRGDEITLEGSGNSFAMKTQSWSKYFGWNGGDYYMDFAEKATDAKWTFTQVDKNIYRLTDNSGSAMGAGNGVPVQVSADANAKNQQWEFLTQADLVNELYYALSDEPKDATFYMPGPAMQNADNNVGNWTITLPKSGIQTNNCEVKKLQTGDFSCFGAWHKGNSGLSKNNEWKIERTITGLPAGTYKVSYQAVIFASNHTFTINGTTAGLDENAAAEPADDTILANMLNGSYTHDVTLKITNEGDYANKIVIFINKTHTSTKTKAYYGNFKITCLGLEGKVDDRLYERVQAAIDDAYRKASEEGTFVNLTGLQSRVDDRDIQGDGWSEVKQAYNTLAEATLKNEEIPADYTNVLLNPSFELYPNYKDSKYNIDGSYPFGWSYPSTYAQDSGVWLASDGNKLINNPDGEYIYNTWAWDGIGGYALAQEVGLTPGIYELTAMVASDEGKNVYLFADNGTTQFKQMVTCSGANTLVPVKVNFMHTSKNSKIGVVGANGTNLDYSANSSWYKADNFRLRRIGDAETITGMEMLQLAINETTTRIKAMNQYDTAWINAISRYQSMIDNFTLKGDGKKEFEEVYDLLRERLFADVPNTEKDYTYAVANPSFEWGNTYGWDVLATTSDTGVRENSNSTYTMSGCDGKYVFNSWDDGAATIISQKINNLPAGHYVLQATFANWANEWVFLEIMGQEGLASQRKAFQLSGDEKVGSVQTLEFEVGEGTPSITIRAGGCNQDGSWSDYGGRFYKVDNFKLIRKGDAQICFFYERLQNAINEANSVASELPEYYAKQWDPSDYQDLMDRHLADGHEVGSGDGTIDPLEGGSGIAEINELFQRLRDLIFSQTETGADMSGAITNNSFELGDLTGWTCAMDPSADAQVTIGTPGTPTYGTNGTDGQYLFNAYKWPGNAHPVYQVIPNVPAGRYTLTVKIASDPDAKFFLGANEQHSDIFVIDKGNGEFTDYSFTFEVPEELGHQDVKIGVYPTTLINAGSITEASFADDAEGSWYKVDHFRLTLDSRYMEVDWEMESDTHGTIMLPFAVSKATLDEKNLEAYTIKMGTKSSNETPADPELNTYRMLTWDGPHNGMIANVPYVLKNVAPQAEVTANKVRAKAAEGEGDENSSRMYKFSGYTEKTSEDVISPKGNLLTGTLVEIPAVEKQHHFVQVEDNVGFVLHDHADDNGVAHETVPAYHAFIDLPEKDLIENGSLVTGFYFHEPTQYLDWEMETEDYGTLILPFDAPLPDGLKAYRLFDASTELKSVVLGETDGDKYQMLNMTEVGDMMDVTDEEGNTVQKVKLTANTPYLIERIANAPQASRKRVMAKADENTDANHYQFAGVAKNSEESYKLEGLMTGVIVSRDDNMGYDENGQYTKNSLVSGDRILTGDAENGYKFEAVTERTPLPRYHAYIDNSTLNGTNDLAPSLYVNEPDYTVEWTMDGEDCGTIILPFDAPVPDDLVAYTISDNATGVKDMPEEMNKTYQELTKVETGTLEANRAYIMMVKAEETPVEVTDDDTAGNEDQTTWLGVPRKAAGKVYTFTGKRGENEVPAENGVLTGTYTELKVSEGDYMLISDGNAFGKVTENTPDTVSSLHAFIPKSYVGDATPDYLLITEPKDVATSVEAIMEGTVLVDVYDMQGVMIKSNVVAAKALRDVAPGIYILRADKKSVKVIKNK